MKHMRYIPVTDTGSVWFGGRITVEHRYNDWMAFVTEEPRTWEVADTPEKAIERLLVTRPDLANGEDDESGS